MYNIIKAELGQDSLLERQIEGWVLRVSESMLYYSSSFLHFLQKSVNATVYTIVVSDDGQIAGIMPYAVCNIPGEGTIVNSLPWYGSHGGCLIAHARETEVRSELLKAFQLEVESIQPLSSTVILSHQEHKSIEQYKGILCPDAIDVRNGQVTELPLLDDDLDDSLAKVLKQKTRNLARKSLKQGFIEECSDSDAAWDFLWETHRENMEAIGGKAKPREHFEALRACIPEENRRLTLSMLDERPVAAMLCIYFNRMVEYITPVIKVEYRNRQPLSFLIWNGMKWATSHGYRYWNWGGTWHTQKSLHHFKAGWGAVDWPYSYLVNITPSGRKMLEERGEEMTDVFPYWFFYPFHLLNNDSA